MLPTSSSSSSSSPIPPLTTRRCSTSTPPRSISSMLRSSSPRQRQRLLRALWFGLIGTLGLLWYYNNEHASTAVRRVVSSKPLIGDDHPAVRAYETSRYCSVDDIALGTWQVHRQFDDLDSIKEAYNLFSNADTSCHAIPSKEEESGLTEDELKFKRIQAAATPSLHPRNSGNSGCQVRQAEPEMVLRRLLRSRSGMTIVGDSISQYTFTVLHDTLQSVSKALVKKNKHSDFHYTLDLNPSHPRISELLLSSGVSPARLRFPLASFYRSDHLVTASQIPEVMGEATWDRLKVKVQRDAPDWWVLWVKLLEDAHGVLPAESEEGTGLNANTTLTLSEEEPDLLVLNSGAHWNVGTLGYCEEEEFVAGYRKMFTDLSKSITQLPFPIASYWRSLAPAHVDCHVLDTFNNARSDWSSPINGHMNQWNYQWYTWMNIIARRHTLKSRSSADWDVPGIIMGKAANPVVRYMNVWDMSMKRPEAHLKPPKDCLHWCMVGVMNYWQELLWNMIVEESKNTDYDVAPRRHD